MSALFKLSYGLYVITSKAEGKDNGLIVNTAIQVTDTPNRVAVTINKSNYSHDVVKETKIMNVNCLSTSAPFEIFKTFGFASGKDTNKFSEITPKYSKNGLAVLPEFINAYMSLKVESYVDLDTHGMFICNVEESEVVSEEPSMTYAYYHENVKPKKTESKKKGFVCKICGYVYEGEELPSDFICPLCKHPATDFEPIN